MPRDYTTDAADLTVRRLKYRCSTLVDSMRTWLINFWDSCRSGFWFLPTLITLAAAGLAVLAIYVDIQTDDYVEQNLPWLTATPDSARAALSAIAGAMVTVAGVVLSITIVALSMTSSQYGSRLIRTFMEQTATQIALGAFVATSLYCLLVLRAVRGGEEDFSFVPHIAVVLSLVLAIASVGILIYFIHCVAMLVQAPLVVKTVAHDLDAAIERLFPEQLGNEPPQTSRQSEDKVENHGLGGASELLDACVEGYLQAIDNDGLLQLAINADCALQLLYRPGDFVIRSTPLARVWSRHSVDDDLCDALNGLFIVGTRRTPRQDVECAVAEMVEVAVRALSPGVNDPFTAVTCVDRLAAALSRLAERQIPSEFRYDGSGRLRIIARTVTFTGVLNAAFDQIRQHARGDVAVTIRLLDGLLVIARCVRDAAAVAAVRRQVEMIVRGCDEAIPEEHDRRDVHERADLVDKALKQI